MLADMLRLLPLSVGLPLLLGCAPLSPSVPIHLHETTEVQPRGRFSLGFGAGGGGLAQEGGGTGGNLRVRVGTGARQEVGLEGAVVYADTGAPRSTGPAWTGKSTAFGARLSWKAAPVPWLALLAGAAASSSATGGAVGGDLGVLFGSGRPLLSRLWPYAAARAFVAVPVGRDIEATGGVTVSLAVPVGMAIGVGRSVRLFFEGGGLFARSSLTTGGDSHGGGYGSAGVLIILERNADSPWMMEALRNFR